MSSAPGVPSTCTEMFAAFTKSVPSLPANAISPRVALFATASILPTDAPAVPAKVIPPPPPLRITVRREVELSVPSTWTLALAAPFSKIVRAVDVPIKSLPLESICALWLFPPVAKIRFASERINPSAVEDPLSHELPAVPTTSACVPERKNTAPPPPAFVVFT